jgi:hypothetical protein
MFESEFHSKFLFSAQSILSAIFFTDENFAQTEKHASHCQDDLIKFFLTHILSNRDDEMPSFISQ